MKKFIQYFIWALKSEKRISENTQKAYLQDLRCFELFFKDNENSKSIFEDYFIYLKEKKLSQSTIIRRVNTINQFFAFCKKENLIEFEFNKKPKVTAQKIYSVCLSFNDYELLKKNLESNFHGIRLKCIIEILYSTGLRISELLNLKVVELEDIVKYNRLAIIGKGNVKRVVFFNNNSILAIEKYIKIRKKNGEYVFNSGASHLTRQRIFQMLKKIAIESGIDPEVVYPHSFRHRLLTDLVKNGADLVSVQKIAGHKQISTTEKYTHVEDYLYDEIKKYHPLLKYKFID